MKDDMVEQEAEALRDTMGEAERRDIEEEEPEFDVKKVPCWVAPKEDGAKILTMPNIPTPLHGLAPRTILGKSTWDHMRKRCYFEAGYKCQACGKAPAKNETCHAHELYTYNYVTGTAKFERCVCLCPTCHVLGIHSGRALTMYKKGNPLMPKSRLLKGAENLFKVLHEYNVAHPNEEPLRAYGTFIDYARFEPLREEMLELIKKYDIKFYREDSDTMAHWNKWSLTLGTKSYPTPYANREEWEAAMAINDKTNQNSVMEKKSAIDLEVDKILGIDKT